MRRIAIVGMGRSGTTYITEFLGKCGVFLDEVNWAYEHELGRLINDTILEREFGARPGLPYGRLPDHEIKLSDYWHRMARFFVKYMDMRAEREDNIGYWAFKDPRTTVLHSIWLENFDIIIGMFRKPQEVVASYIGQGWVRGFWKKQLVLSYWKRFYKSLLHIYDTYKDKKEIYILNYNEDMSVQTSILCDKLKIIPTPEAKSLFNTSLKHYNEDEFPKDKEARDLYDALMDIRIMNNNRKT
jgi:hypothetical protein